MPNEFIYCPRCGSKELENAGYEDEKGEDSKEVACSDCNWVGMPEELVCAPEKER